jgi:uncharacterized lipoprotein YddW (UPF0748 family)
MPVWKPDEAPPKDPAHLFHTHGEAKTGRDNWLTCDENGNAKYGIGYFLDAGHPDVPNHLVQVVSDIVKNYAVDGIHLDYIRYPTPDSGTDETGYGVGYNSVSVERFNRAHKRTGKPAKNDPAWCDWRRTQVTELVRRFRMHLLELKPSVMLSAALIPWGDGPLSEEAWTKTAPYNRVFQNWHEWRKEGLLDIIVPMNYDRDHLPQQKAFFDHWIDFERKHPYRSKVIVGVGAYLNTVPNTESQIRRALTARDGMPAADGICLFSYAALRKAQPGSDKPTLSELQKALVTASTQPGTEPLFAKPFVAPVVTRAMK